MLPNLSNPVRAYMQKLTFDLITKSIVNFELQETRRTITTMGVRQPVDPQKLQIMPEGQRAWRYECLHLLPKIQIKIDDIVVFRNVQYRVVEKYDCSEYGYIEYMIAQTFEEQEESSSESI